MRSTSRTGPGVPQSFMKLCPTPSYSLMSRATALGARPFSSLAAAPGSSGVPSAVTGDDGARPGGNTGGRREGPVIRCGRVEHAAVGQQETETTAHAEARRSHLPRRPVVGAQGGGRGDDVVDRRTRPRRQRPKGRGDAERFGAALEERRREGQVAAGGEPVGDPADVVVQAEDLVQHHDRGPRPQPRGDDEVARQAAAGDR